MKMLWARGALTAGFLAMSAWAAPCSTQAQDLADRQREDITFLRQHYLPREQAFTQNSRAAAERYIDQLESRAGSLSDAQLFLGFARVAALADNAHSIAGIGHSYDPGPRLPLVITWFDDAGLVILRALPPNEDLAGGEITAINGRPAAEVMDAFRQYYGGPATRRNILAPSLLSTPSMLVAAGLADTTSSVLVRVTLADGTEVERNIATVPRATLGASAWWPSRWWSPEPIGEDTTAWATAISTEDLPLYLRDSDSYNRAVPLPDLDAVYLELKSNDADRDARQFATRAERALRQNNPRNIIVDLRFDSGGDMTITANFFERLPRYLGENGRLFVIVGRYTFSAGIGSAAILLNAAGDRATLVGEDMSDRSRFYSEGGVVCAPNSGYCLRYTDGLYDHATGCAGQPLCRRENRRFHLIIGSLHPTLFAPTTWRDYLAKRDPAMEAIRASLQR